jgi:GNAT superfamily N-acetyltransferase
VSVRRATPADGPAIQELWRAFCAESPAPEYVEVPDVLDLEVGETWVAELDGGLAGYALASRKRGVIELHDLYVRPEQRRRGLGRELIAAVAEEWPDASHLRLLAALDALPFYDRLGFGEESRRLAVSLPVLQSRLAKPTTGRTFGSIHVQTDDLSGIERAVRQFVPRLPGGSRGSIVAPPRNGWIGIYDDVIERDPRQLRRLARELGDRTGGVVLALGVEEGAVTRFILFERGSVVDEYLSIQEHFGPLPPGDVIALAANPRVVARLTGADPAAVRAAAVHGATPADLPPPEETLGAIAAAVGVEGATHAWSDAPDIPGAIRIDR